MTRPMLHLRCGCNGRRRRIRLPFDPTGYRAHYRRRYAIDREESGVPWRQAALLLASLVMVGALAVMAGVMRP